METNLQELTAIKDAVTKAKESKANKTLRQEAEAYYGDYQDRQEDEESQGNISAHIMLPATRSMARRTKDIRKRPSNTTPESPHEQQSSKEGITPAISEGRIKWKRIPREPIPQLSDVNL